MIKFGQIRLDWQKNQQGIKPIKKALNVHLRLNYQVRPTGFEPVTPTMSMFANNHYKVNEYRYLRELVYIF